MDTLGKRVEAARIRAGKSQAEVADAVGIKQPSYHQIESGKTKRSSFLPAISRFLKVRLEWLETGEYPMVDDGQSNLETTSISEWDNDTALDDDEFELPYYKDVELSGGDGFTLAHDDGRRKLRYAKTTARATGASMSQSFCTTLVGDSMADLIPNGSMVAVDSSKKQIRDGEIYAFRHGELYRIKYLSRLPDGGIKIRSHNPEYNDEIIKPDEAQDIEILGWVWNWSVLRRW